MTDITTIPMEELLEDRAASEMDALVWTRLSAGRGDVEANKRIWENQRIIAVIDAEIKRREIPHDAEKEG